MKKNFILGYFFGLFLFFITPEQNSNRTKIEEINLRSLKNEIVVFNTNKNIFINSSKSSIYDVVEVVNKKESPNLNLTDIQTKETGGRENSIFVESLRQDRIFPTRPNFNHYDPVENQFVDKSVMSKAHLTCVERVDNLPRHISKKDRNVKFDKKYNGLFKKDKNYKKVFSYNLYLNQNLSKESSRNKIKQGESKMYKKYGKKSMDYLRKNLFQNPDIIKSEKCKYLDTENLVTIYYNEFTDLFAIVDSTKNYLLDFGIASEVKYAEIFAYKSFGNVERKKICITPNPSVKCLEPEKSKELQVYQEQYFLSSDDAIDILEEKYGSSFLSVKKGEFKIQEWQAAKKLEHAICFGLDPKNFNFSQDQAKQINKGGIVAYVRQGNQLPSLDFIRSYQNVIKNFCEDQNKSIRNDESLFRGRPSITFFNKETRQVVIFDQETKIFITAYKLAPRQINTYITTGSIGNN